MAFGGGAGIPGDMISPTAARVPYGSTGLITYDADGITAMFSAGGRVLSQSRKLFHTLYITLNQDEFIGQQNVPLSAFVDQSLDGSAVDTGVLVSAAPAANQHGLPANFGPGRDNWLFPDLYRLQFAIDRCRVTTWAAAGGIATPAVFTSLQGPNNRDIQIVVKNQCATDLIGLHMHLWYRHSQIL